MNATDLLRAQHDEVNDLFEKIDESESDDEVVELFEQLATNLVAHDAIEREIFYPACEEELGMIDLLGESLVEHGVIEFSLFRADQNLGGEDFDFYIAVLQEMVDHHIEEEETELFPKVEKAFGKERLEQLGAEMAERFDQALEEGFREPLLSNLRATLAGALQGSTQGAQRDPETKTAKKKTTSTRKTATKRPTNGKGSTARTHH